MRLKEVNKILIRLSQSTFLLVLFLSYLIISVILPKTSYVFAMTAFGIWLLSGIGILGTLVFVIIVFAYKLHLKRNQLWKTKSLIIKDQLLTHQLICQVFFTTPGFIVLNVFALNKVTLLSFLNNDLVWKLTVLSGSIATAATIFAFIILVWYKKTISIVSSMQILLDEIFEDDDLSFEIEQNQNLIMKNHNQVIMISFLLTKHNFLTQSFIKQQLIINESKRSSNPPLFFSF